MEDSPEKFIIQNNKIKIPWDLSTYTSIYWLINEIS